jgi:hypothetical protein
MPGEKKCPFARDVERLLKTGRFVQDVELKDDRRLLLDRVGERRTWVAYRSLTWRTELWQGS